MSDEILCMGGERLALLGPWSDNQGHGHAILAVQDGEIRAGAMMSPSDLRALAALLTKAADALDLDWKPPPAPTPIPGPGRRRLPG